MYFTSELHLYEITLLQTVYKGRKKKTIEYFAIKSVDKSHRSKVLQEVSISTNIFFSVFDLILGDLHCFDGLVYDFSTIKL